MTNNATKIAAGTSLLGVGGMAGVLLAPQKGAAPAAAVTLPAPPAVVRTVHIKHVHYRTVHEHPKASSHQAVGAAAGASAVTATPAAPAPQPVAAPVPAPVSVQPRIRTRTSGGGGGGAGGEHEGESEGHDD
jgi:hypothetical protein